MRNWQEHYAKGDTPWDKGRGHPLIGLLEPGLIGGRWLVPGCGFGHDADALVNAGADSVLGLDIAPTAVEKGSGLWVSNPKITIELSDFFMIDKSPHAGTFDGIWEHTCFCAIDPSMREQYVRSAVAALRPRGLLVACFYLTPWDPDEDQTQGPPFGSHLESLDELFSEFFFLEKEYLPPATFPGREGKEWLRILRRRE